MKLINNKNEAELNMEIIKNNNTVTRCWSKKNLQSVLSSIRQSNNELIVIESFPDDMLRYVVSIQKDNKKKVILEAMNGRFDYLVTYDKNLFKLGG